MSLNWSIEEILNYRTVCYDRMTRTEVEAEGNTIEEVLKQSNFMGCNWYTPGGSETEKLANCDVIERLSPLTNVLIWATMSVGMGSITEANYGEFWARINMMERLTGPFLSKPTDNGKSWEPRHITLEEVKAHTGLGTNVHLESWTSWTKRRTDQWRKDALSGKDLDAGPWKPSVSQVAKDTSEQIDRLAQALTDAEIYGDSDIEKEAEAQVERDLTRIYKMEDHVRCMKADWEDIERKIDAAEEAEGEK